jgi:5-oxoprolinase (ATP-hydrolysing)
MNTRRVRTAVDRGGTFTDVVRLGPDGVSVRKVRSDVAVVGDLADGHVTYGTTVATNALLERAGAPVLLVVGEGFADLSEIGDMTRPSLFEPDVVRAPSLARRVVEAAGRVDGAGMIVEPLVIPDLPLDGVEAVAVVLPHAPLEPAHERAVAAAVPSGVPVFLGHQECPAPGYLARIETTLVEASITPVLRRAVARDALPAGALAMRSDGSLVAAEQLGAADAVLSGPAGGVLAVAALADRLGLPLVIGLDMGGTSTDVCVVEGGVLPYREETPSVGGVRVRRPVLEVVTIAAGGGSVLWRDGVRLGVGPASAGANPGPQCWGGGGPPTVTDAALVAGLLDPNAFDPPLDPALVSLPGDADAFLSIAREAMAAAIRRVAGARGVDPRAAALVAYGGAAGQHAAEVAARCGIRTVVIHPCASVFSAFGQLFARPEHRISVPLRAALPGAFVWVADAARRAVAALPAAGGGEVAVSAAVRVVGTELPIELSLDPAAGPDALVASFEQAYRQRFGYVAAGALEVVEVRARWGAPRPEWPAVRSAWGVGAAPVAGPRVVHTPTTSIVVPVGWTARAADDVLLLERVAAMGGPDLHDHAGVAVWSTRFVAVAEEAGVALQRLARSVSIRERRDFSCGVFDGAGRLVASAPHVPVHLGAMGETVRDLIRTTDLWPGGAWAHNDPAAGGSHLPDITVVTPVSLDGAQVFVACRGHHVDVGGSTPGSMPPRASRRDEEGIVLRHLCLVDRGGAWRDPSAALAGCRDVPTVIADLRAQVAANASAAAALARLGDGATVTRWMGRLLATSEAAVRHAVARLGSGDAADVIDGVPLRLAVRRAGSGLRFDFTGTGGPHPGNLNAPPAVTRAAILYALRVLVGGVLSLDEGALGGVEIVLPTGSILDPPADRAVAGGNVETSMRVADLVLRAIGGFAASQGTMNNLTIGGDGWAIYETIGGGQGAGPRGRGPSGRQIHMTNTRATDPELLESRAPVAVRRMALRRGSGGVGRHDGGDGLIRELELLAPARVSLLATRRDAGAPGQLGGGAGAPGADFVRWPGGAWLPWDGATVTLPAGARVRVETPGGGAIGETVAPTSVSGSGLRVG